MNRHKLYSALVRAEQGVHHLRKAWTDTEGVAARSLSERQVTGELNHARRLLAEATDALKEAADGATPEEPKPE